MSTNKYFTYIPKLNKTVLHVEANGFNRIHFPGLLQWLAGYLANKEVDFTLGNESFTEGGYYQTSAKQISQEHAIDIVSVNLLLPLIR